MVEEACFKGHFLEKYNTLYNMKKNKVAKDYITAKE